MSDHPLKSAAQNPWYLLLTVYGEQGKVNIDTALHDRNRRIWNGWALGHLPPEERQRLAKEAKIDIAETAPLTKAEMKDVRERFDAVLGPDHVLPDPRKPVNFSRTRFSVKLATSNCVFYSSANFGDATFNGYANFRGATFARRANFRGATFTEGVAFKGATFGRVANFQGANFTSWATFQGATFAGGAYFEGATFTRGAGFQGATFTGRADFEGATFNRGVDFDNAKFKSSTNLEIACFGQVPRIFEAELHSDTKLSMEPENWPQPNPKTAEDAAYNYSRLRQFMNKLQKPEDEHFFFRQEMRCRALIGKPWKRLPYQLFGLVSEFGYSIKRPLVGLAIVFALGVAAFWGYFASCCPSAPAIAIEHPLGVALGLSFADTFIPFGLGGRFFNHGFYAELPAVLKFLTALQTILGFTFLFFLGLGLRNRFRLR